MQLLQFSHSFLPFRLVSTRGEPTEMDHGDEAEDGDWRTSAILDGPATWTPAPVHPGEGLRQVMGGNGGADS